MENIKYLFKDAFAVIGKAGHGAADKGSEWIKPLWEVAGATYSEIADVCKKSENGGLFWWGAMNDSEEQNKVWGDTGKYMAGCEADIKVNPPEGWIKWIIPAQTYLVVSASPDKYGEVFCEVMGDKDNIITGSIHEYYPVPDNPSVMELWFPVAAGMTFCKSCYIPMTKPDDFGNNREYCHYCSINGSLRGGVTIDALASDMKKLIDIETAHPNLVSTPLLAYIKNWLLLDEATKMATVPALLSELIDGQDCDFTGTQWEKEWLADGKVCHCIACAAARKCISDIKLMVGNGKCSSHLI